MAVDMADVMAVIMAGIMAGLQGILPPRASAVPAYEGPGAATTAGGNLQERGPLETVLIDAENVVLMISIKLATKRTTRFSTPWTGRIKCEWNAEGDGTGDHVPWLTLPCERMMKQKKVYPQQ